VQQGRFATLDGGEQMQFNMNWRADNKKAIRASEENKERCSTSLLKL
jgi:hypothetical protein